MNRDHEDKQRGQNQGGQQQQGNPAQHPGQEQQGGGTRNPGQQQQQNPKPQNPNVNDEEKERAPGGQAK